MLKNIRISNLGPFAGAHDIPLTEGVLSIEGRYTDKPGESNRAGKSSFVDAIRFALYGQHRHRQLKQYINRKADTAKDSIGVSLWLECNGGELHINRYYDATVGRFTLDVPELDIRAMKATEQQSYLESIIGCDYDNALRTWLVLQEDTKGIMALPLAERKRFLLDLFSPVVYPWDSYYTEAASRHSRLSIRAQELESRLSRLAEIIESSKNRNIPAEIKSLRVAIAEKQSEQARLMSDQKSLEDRMSPATLNLKAEQLKQDELTLKDLYVKLQQSKRDVERLIQNEAVLKSRENELIELERTLLSLESKVQQLNLEKMNSDYQVAYDKLTTANAQLQTMMNELSRVEQFDGVCPVTQEECPKGAAVTVYRSNLEKRIRSAAQVAQQLESERDRLETILSKNDNIFVKINTVKGNIDANKRSIDVLLGTPELLVEARARYEHDEKFAANLKTRVDSAKRELEARRASEEMMYKGKVRELQQQQQDVTRELSRLTNDMSSLMAEEKENKLVTDEHQKVKQELMTIKRRARALQALKPMLAQDGLPFMHIISSIAEFEDAINNALRDLGTDLRVEVEPYTTMSTLSPVCTVCGFEFPQTNMSKRCLNSACRAPRENKKKETLEIRLKGSVFDVNYDEDSGGGQQWVAVGIRFALYNLLRERGLMQDIDFWLMDEIFAPLSDVGKQAMLNFLDIVCTNYGINQLFLITHTDISSILPPAIIVQRTEATQTSTIIV